MKCYQRSLAAIRQNTINVVMITGSTGHCPVQLDIHSLHLDSKVKMLRMKISYINLLNAFDGLIVKYLVVCACPSHISNMRNNREAAEKRNANNDVLPSDMLTIIGNTQTSTIISDINPKNFSITEKLDSKRTQSVEEKMESINLTEASSESDEFNVIQKPSENILETNGKQKLTVYEEELTKGKLRKNKLDSIKQQIPTSSLLNIASNQDLPDFAQEGAAPPLTKHVDLKPISRKLSKKVKSTESLKTAKINYGETDQLSQQKSFAYNTAEKGPIPNYFLPSCILYTFIRLIALILLFCALIIVYAFPCLRFTYHIPVIKGGMIESVAEKIPLRKTCRLMPHWWSDQKAFVGSIIETTRYFQALNLSMNQTEEHFEIFEDKNTIEILKPFNGQIFVIIGCIVLAFPILLLLMLLRCMSEEEDLMEEAMFDLAEISIFCVNVKLCVTDNFICHQEQKFELSWIQRVPGIWNLVLKSTGTWYKEKVYNICTDVKIEAYSFLSSGSIFLFLVFLFAIDLIILLKIEIMMTDLQINRDLTNVHLQNAEEVESRKYLQMAACLHYDKTLKCMTESVLEGVSVESVLLRKK
uniref:Pannexin_like domain-containing protein n=1 Tax=Elaeophora elaphi TaxID=1147741 RepID=A0A0R3S0I2_9BILA